MPNVPSKRPLPSYLRVLWAVALIWFVLCLLLFLVMRRTRGFGLADSEEGSRQLAAIFVQAVFIELALLLLAGSLSLVRWLRREFGG